MEAGATDDPELLGGAGKLGPSRSDFAHPTPCVSLSLDHMIDSGLAPVRKDALMTGPQVSESGGEGLGRLCEGGAALGVGASVGGRMQTVYMSCAPEHAHIVSRAIYKMCARDTRRVRGRGWRREQKNEERERPEDEKEDTCTCIGP